MPSSTSHVPHQLCSRAGAQPPILSMASSCKHAPLQARLTHGNTMPAFPTASSSGGTCSLGCPGDTAGTWRRPRVSLAPSGGLQQHSKPPSLAKKSHELRRTPSGHDQDSLGWFLTAQDTKISSQNKVPPNSFQEAPETCPGVLLKAAYLSPSLCYQSLLAGVPSFSL